MEQAGSVTEWNTVTGTSYELFFGYPDEAALSSVVEQLVADGVASGIARQDATLWGPDAEAEAAKRLSWVGFPESSRGLVSDIAALEVEHREQGLTRVVLCGMGGSSLAPEVICGAAGVELVVVDSSDPDFVRAAIEERLAETVVVVSSKSGGTVETDSQRRAFEKAFSDAGIEPAERIVVVTDPGSPLEKSAREAGYRVYLADPDVGGRYSALVGVRPGAERAGRRRHRRAARRGRGDPSRPRGRLRRQPRAAARWPARCRQPGRRRQGGARERRLDVPRPRRLGRAADRRVDRQGRQGHPAGRRRRRSTRPTSTRAPPTRCSPRSGQTSSSTRSARPRVGRHRRRAPRRADAAVGVRHRGGRPADRHQPVRPARRRERQGGRAHHARRRRQHARRRSSSTGR